MQTSQTPAVPAEHWLRNEHAEAAFTPSDGFNCSAFRVRLPVGHQTADRTIHALAEAPDWAALRARPSFYGNPLLFPFAYGIAGGTLRSGGQTHRLAPTRWGRVAHGLVRDHAWTVEAASETEIRAAFRSEAHPQSLAEFPEPFSLTINYTLEATTLSLQAEAVNRGQRPMPFGFGIHPYVSLPLDSPGQPGPHTGPSDEVVTCDATRVNTDGAGASGTARSALPAVQGPFDLRQGQPATVLFAAQRALRNQPGLYLTYAKEPGARGLRWSLASPRLDAVVEIEASPELWAMVLFAPPEQEVISPVIGTCLPGFLDYPDDPDRSRDLGLLELAPGATWQCSATIGVRRLTS